MHDAPQTQPAYPFFVQASSHRTDSLPPATDGGVLLARWRDDGVAGFCNGYAACNASSLPQDRHASNLKSNIAVFVARQRIFSPWIACRHPRRSRSVRRPAPDFATFLALSTAAEAARDLLLTKHPAPGQYIAVLRDDVAVMANDNAADRHGLPGAAAVDRRIAEQHAIRFASRMARCCVTLAFKPTTKRL